MADPNMSDFYGRVARIQKARAKGFGFEAPGTLGRSYYHRPVVRRRPVVLPLLFLLLCVILLKGTMYQQIGAKTYNSRVAELMAGKGMDRVGGWLMQADPATVYAAGQIEVLLLKIK